MEQVTKRLILHVGQPTRKPCPFCASKLPKAGFEVSDETGATQHLCRAHLAEFSEVAELRPARPAGLPPLLPLSQSLTTRSASMKRPTLKKVILLLLIATLPLGPVGCGPEVIPVIVSTCLVVGIVAITIHELQEVQSAQLDIEMKRLTLQGMRNGRFTTVERSLSDDQLRKIVDSGKVQVNGNVLTFRPE